MNKKVFRYSMIAAIMVCAMSYSYKSPNKLSETTMENIEALAEDENDSPYEYPDSYLYAYTCGVSIGKWKNCKATVIACPGGGNGCDPDPCPVHG